MSVIGFHNPDELYGFLSNWYLSEFTVDGVNFSSMEQYMMYKKAILFEDADIAAKILDTDDVVIIKELGRKVSGYNDSVWNGMRQVIIYNPDRTVVINRLKDKGYEDADIELSDYYISCRDNDKLYISVFLYVMGLPIISLGFVFIGIEHKKNMN